MTTENLQASVNVARYPSIKPDMLVEDTAGNIGIVTKTTSKWVHVTVLIMVQPLFEFHGYDTEEEFQAASLGDENYHASVRYKRPALTILPPGFTLAIKQKAR